MPLTLSKNYESQLKFSPADSSHNKFNQKKKIQQFL